MNHAAHVSHIFDHVTQYIHPMSSVVDRLEPKVGAWPLRGRPTDPSWPPGLPRQYEGTRLESHPRNVPNPDYAPLATCYVGMEMPEEVEITDRIVLTPKVEKLYVSGDEDSPLTHEWAKAALTDRPIKAMGKNWKAIAYEPDLVKPHIVRFYLERYDDQTRKLLGIKDV